eukprot:6291919-Prymnesium_polylepis.1
MPSAATPSLVAALLAAPTAAAATDFVAKTCSRWERADLAALAAVEAAWQTCDQAIAANVADLAAMVVAELFEPFWFYRTALRGAGEQRSRGAPPFEHHAPRALFLRKMATRALHRNGKEGFWTARGGTHAHGWLPDDAAASFDAVVHFVQSGSGTGVHVGGGRVLTCAHVVDARDDALAEEEGEEPPERVGRAKLVMFPSGRVFLATCAAVRETADGSEDAALCVLGAE